jgi:hypothetical protein
LRSRSRPAQGLTLLLNDDTIIALSRRADIVSEFPWFRLQVAKAPSGCRCNRSAAARHSVLEATHRVKLTLTALAADQLHRLKVKLGVEKLEFFTRQGRRII